MTNNGVSRRNALVTAGAVAAVTTLSSSGASSVAVAQEALVPKMKRFKMATIGVPDLGVIEPLYRDWIGYTVIERGGVPADLAASWGAPNSAGRPYIVMQPESGTDVFTRAVEIDPVPDYKALTTWGWNAIEIIADDSDALYEKLKDSPFTIIGTPETIQNYPSIRAFQIRGPAEEVLYLTCEAGDRDKSTLPPPRAMVDRPFVMVLAGPNLMDMENVYGDTFAMAKGARFSGALTLISHAQGLPTDTIYSFGLLRLNERGNNIELDGYPASTGPRPRADGQLPPGVAMVSFNIDDLDGVTLDFIADPIVAYGGSRSATFIGPVGELTELIEEQRT